MQQSRIRFRIRDLLRATALVAVYLAACRQLQLRPNNRIGIRPNELAILVFLGAIILGFFVGFARVVQARARLNAGRVVVQLELPVRWRFFFVLVTLVWLCALASRFSPVGFVLFVSFSTILFAEVVLSVLNPDADVTPKGVITTSGGIAWDRIYPLRQADGQLTHLRFQNPFFWTHRVPVPPDLRPTIEELIAASRAGQSETC